MDKIAEYLNDPSWWFSTVFVAIFASLLAGYLKDALGVRLARTSTWYRTRQANAILERQQRLETLASDSTSLIFEMIRVGVAFLIILLAVLMLMLLLVLVEVMQPPSAMSLQARLLVKLAIIVLGIVAMICGFKLPSEIFLVREAHHAYRLKRAATK